MTKALERRVSHLEQLILNVAESFGRYQHELHLKAFVDFRSKCITANKAMKKIKRTRKKGTRP